MDKSWFKVLIVDDEEGLREGLEKTLSLEGYSVSTAATGWSAVEQLKEEQFHLAFIDLKLTDISGIEVVENVLPTLTPIVIMTAYASVESAVSSMKIGVLDYIQKPFNNSDILAIADRFFQEKMGGKVDVQLSSDKIPNIILKSEKSVVAFQTIEKVKDSDIPVLLLGESGTGKEVFARMIHDRGSRNKNPFIGINCSAIPAELLESELFGHEKGAFSGSVSTKPGKFEIAKEGTLFLDEIGDMDFKLQAKLLRVLEEKTFEHIGGISSIQFKARIIASTNKDLKYMVSNQEFRSDLYFRLRGVELVLPPLRERPEDLELLIHNYVELYANSYQKKVSVSSEAISSLKDYDWPGNIRELKNVIETAVLLSDDNSLLLSGNFRIDQNDDQIVDLPYMNDLEKNYIIRTLEKNRFNRTLTAKDLNISRKTLYNKLKKFSID
jgi:two-component system, NtrC family, response regulator AtoC